MFSKQANKKRVCNIYFLSSCKVFKLTKIGGCYILDSIVHVSSHFHTSLFVFYLIFFSPHFIDHVSIHVIQSTVHLIHVYLPYFVVAFILHTLSFNLIVSFTVQPLQSLEINDIWVSLDIVYIF